MTWEKVKLGDVYDVHNGLSKGGQYFGSGYPFLSFSTVFNHYFIPDEITEFVQSTEKEQENYSIKRGDVFITRTSETFDELGMSCVALKDYPQATYNGFTKRLRPKTNKILPEFIGYYFRTPAFRNEFQAFSTMTTRASLRNQELLGLSIPVPPMEMQKRIADVLSAYDDLIENNERQIRLLEEAAQRLYKEWFIRLRFPGHESTPIIDGIPEGWHWEKIKNVCQLIGGGTPSTKIPAYYKNGDIPWVTPTDVTKNNCIALLNTERKITEEGLTHSTAKMVPADTILMTSRASVGYFGICAFPVCTNQGFISCIPYELDCQMYLLMNLMCRVEEIRQKAGGSTYLEISKKIFGEFDILIPATDILVNYQRFAYSVLEQIRKLAQMIHLLQEARDRLLPKLMNDTNV